MIRVLNIISDTNIGGAGRWILHYLRNADTDQFTVLAAIPRGSLLKAPLQEAGAEVHEVDGIADRTFSREDVKVLRTLIRQLHPDLVHTHGSLSGRIAAKSCRIPVVTTRHSVFPVPGRLHYPPGRWVNGIVNRLTANRIIAVSPAAQTNLTDSGVFPSQISVVMNGTEPVPRLDPDSLAPLRSELGLTPETFVFGILTRIEDYKGHVYLLHAAKRLKQRGYQNFRILIAGTGSLEKELAREIIVTGVRDVVTLLGFREDTDALLNLLDVQLNTSYATEATNLALLEGMSLGLPTIASNYGGTPYVVEDHVTGLLFPIQNVDALTDCMAELMDNPEERLEMGRQARLRFDSTFTGTAFAAGIERIYREVLGNPAADRET